MVKFTIGTGELKSGVDSAQDWDELAMRFNLSYVVALTFFDDGEAIIQYRNKAVAVIDPFYAGQIAAHLQHGQHLGCGGRNGASVRYLHNEVA